MLLWPGDVGSVRHEVARVERIHQEEAGRYRWFDPGPVSVACLRALRAGRRLASGAWGLGGSLPNDVFTDGLGLPTIWIPHSYPACAQHAPDEHLLAPLARQALRLMAGLFWDLGDHDGALASHLTPGERA